MRLIDADELKKMFMSVELAVYAKWTLNGIISEIDDAPTICDIEQIRAEIEQLPSDMGEAIDLRTGQITTKYISSQKALQIIDKYTKGDKE